MSKIILLIQGHPDPAGGHLCHGLADAYAAGAQEAGHRVLRVCVADLSFPLVRTEQDLREDAAPADLAEARGALLQADHVVIIFPLWLGTMPAVLKGFFEQLMRPGFAYAYDAKGTPHPLLGGRTARIVVTMGMPALVFRLWFLSAGLSVLTRNILGLVGIAPARATVLGGVGATTAPDRADWMAAMRRLGAAAR